MSKENFRQVGVNDLMAEYLDEDEESPLLLDASDYEEARDRFRRFGFLGNSKASPSLPPLQKKVMI